MNLVLSTPIPDIESMDFGGTIVDRTTATNSSQKICAVKTVNHRYDGVFNTKTQAQPFIRYSWITPDRLARFSMIYSAAPDQDSEECRNAIRT